MNSSAQDVSTAHSDGMNKDKIQLRRLGASDAVTGFDCGDDDLNDFIKTDSTWKP